MELKERERDFVSDIQTRLNGMEAEAKQQLDGSKKWVDMEFGWERPSAYSCQSKLDGFKELFQSKRGELSGACQKVQTRKRRGKKALNPGFL